MLKLVFYDDREASPTRGELREVFTGELNYCRVSIPPGLKHAARAYGGERVRVLVLSDKPFDPDVSDKTVVEPPVDYDWAIKINLNPLYSSPPFPRRTPRLPRGSRPGLPSATYVTGDGVKCHKRFFRKGNVITCAYW